MSQSQFVNGENRLSVDLRELLKFYAEAGVDDALDEIPRDRFAEFATQQGKADAGRRPSPAGPQPTSQPGGVRDEDIEGLPFVGRAGQLLDRMLAAIGIHRSTGAYIANVIPWRPPGNRTPTPQETEICRPFIERQIELADPKVLVALGGPSAK